MGHAFGQMPSAILPPPQRPIDWPLALGWIAVTATALGIFWGAQAGWGTGRREVRGNRRSRRRRRVSRNAKKGAPKFSEMKVWESVATVREARPREHLHALPPGVAAKFKRLPPGLYKYGWGPKKGESIVQFKNASLKGAITSTRIGAGKVGEFHWVVDNFDPSFPVIVRTLDERGHTVFRVEEYARMFEREPVKVRRSTSARR